MITKIKTLFILLLSLTIFVSCDDDDDIKKPIVKIHELGEGFHQHQHEGEEHKAEEHKHEGGYYAHVGGDLHIDAEIIAEGTIAKIQVELHKEGADDEVEFNDFPSHLNKKNTDFHVHVDLPQNLSTGEYHFHLVVTDKEGNSTTAEAHIELRRP
jgi:hypothetical protein